jgi:type IV secretory pathway TraG/TraD family ATPase VirD4
MAAGQPPVILQRVLYYEAPHFAGMFDPVKTRAAGAALK